MEEQKAEQDNRFLKGRKIANTIYDNFKISETGEALLDLDDLVRVQLNNDNVQGFDRHQVRRRYIKNVYKKQLHFSGLKRPHDFVPAGYSPQTRSGQFFSIERYGPPLRRAENKGQMFECPQ